MNKTKVIEVLGVKLIMRDLAASNTIEWVQQELNSGDYNLQKIPFEPGDFIVDVGANVGVTAIYLAKKHPNVTVYSYEPLIDNYINLLHNRWQNGTANLHCIHGAIGLQYGLIDIKMVETNSGGSYTQKGESYLCYSLEEQLTLLNNRHGRKAKLLKVDCEGYEKEIFKIPYDHLAEYLSIETHGNLQKTVIQNINKHGNKLWVKKA